MSRVVPHTKGRSYWVTARTQDAYDNEECAALNLQGKTLRYTTDMSGTGCGCNTAPYLTSLRQSTGKSCCGDHYCAANHICGQSCAEIDNQEAKQHGRALDAAHEDRPQRRRGRLRRRHGLERPP